MQEHHNIVNELLNLISVKHPIIGMGISWSIMALGVILPDLHNGVWDWEIPKIIMQGIQISLGSGGFLIGYFTFRRNRNSKK